VPTHTTPQIPRAHLERRAQQIAALSEGPEDQLLTDQQLAAWFGVSPQWPAQARIGGYGPPFVRSGPKRIRYRRDMVNAWLLSRQDTSTAVTPAWNRGIPNSNRKLNGADARVKPVAATGFKRGNAAPEHSQNFANLGEQPQPNRFKRGN
jgi:hypothetical protein